MHPAEKGLVLMVFNPRSKYDSSERPSESATSGEMSAFLKTLLIDGSVSV
jgi:hypothetical protein